MYVGTEIVRKDVREARILTKEETAPQRIGCGVTGAIPPACVGT
jgi:hypothetical protein